MTVLNFCTFVALSVLLHVSPVVGQASYLRGGTSDLWRAIRNATAVTSEVSKSRTDAKWFNTEKQDDREAHVS